MTVIKTGYQCACAPEATSLYGGLALAFPSLVGSRINVVTFAETQYPRQAVLNQLTRNPVGMAAHKGLIFLAWQGIDVPGQISLTWSKDGVFANNEDSINRIDLPHTASGGVSLASYRGRLFLAWCGGGGLGGADPNLQINIAWSDTADIPNWPAGNLITLAQRSEFRPALCAGWLYEPTWSVLPTPDRYDPGIPPSTSPDGKTTSPGREPQVMPGTPGIMGSPVQHDELWLFWVDPNSRGLYTQRCDDDYFMQLTRPPATVSYPSKKYPGGLIGVAKGSGILATLNWDASSGKMSLGALFPNGDESLPRDRNHRLSTTGDELLDVLQWCQHFDS